MEGIREIFIKNIKDINKNTGCISTPIGQLTSCLEYKGRWLVDKIGHYLFDEAEVYLERKYKKFQKFFEYNKTHPRKWRWFSKVIVCKIKHLYKTDELTQEEIAQKFNISQPFVSRIINNKRYQQYAI